MSDLHCPAGWLPGLHARPHFPETLEAQTVAGKSGSQLFERVSLTLKKQRRITWKIFYKLLASALMIYYTPASTSGLRIGSGDPFADGSLCQDSSSLSLQSQLWVPHRPASPLPSVQASCRMARKQESVCRGLAVCQEKRESHFKVTH